LRQSKVVTSPAAYPLTGSSPPVAGQRKGYDAMEARSGETRSPGHHRHWHDD